MKKMKASAAQVIRPVKEPRRRTPQEVAEVLERNGAPQDLVDIARKLAKQT
jgi:hypothetical protein